MLAGTAGPGLLDTYAQERRAHVWAMIRLALRMGRIMAPPSRLAGLATRAAFTALRVWRPASDYVLQMKYKPKPRFEAGFLLPPGRTAPELVGRLFPQPQVTTVYGEDVLLDEAMGQGFCLLARTAEPAALFARLAHPVWKALAARRVAVLPADADVRETGGIVTVGELDGTIAASLGRTPDAILLLRPDRYVACAFTLAEADAAAAAMQALLDATRRPAQTAANPERQAA